MKKTTNYYEMMQAEREARMTAKATEFLDTIFANYYNYYANKLGETYFYVPVYDLNLSIFKIVEIARARGIDAKYKRDRSIVVKI